MSRLNLGFTASPGRRLTGQDIMQGRAEPEHIGCRGHFCACYLLGCRICQRHRGARIIFRSVVEQSRNTKVHKPHLAFMGDQNIGWFDIAVQHKAGMSMSHCRADIKKESDTL